MVKCIFVVVDNIYHIQQRPESVRATIYGRLDIGST